MRLGALGAVGLMLAGCAAFSSRQQIDALEAATMPAGMFDARLVQEYRDFAIFEHEEMFDYTDAEHFARKGLMVAEGQQVLPERPEDWQLPPGMVEELNQARGQLLAALEGGARDIAPDEAAVAQARYDCWVEQQEEEWQDGDIAACRDSFWLALETLDEALMPEEEVVEDVPPVIPSQMRAEPLPEMAPEDAFDQASFLVFFDFAEAELTPVASSVVETIVDEFNRSPAERITLIGHADTTGAAAFNETLSANRAQQVRAALIARGVPPDMIELEARGETDLLVETPDNVREPANRRVEIRMG